MPAPVTVTPFTVLAGSFGLSAGSPCGEWQSEHELVRSIGAGATAPSSVCPLTPAKESGPSATLEVAPVPSWQNRQVGASPGAADAPPFIRLPLVVAECGT